MKTPSPLIQCLHMTESKGSIFEMKFLRKIQNLNTKPIICDNIFNIDLKKNHKPKQRSLSNECKGYNSLVPEYILHCRGLNIFTASVNNLTMFLLTLQKYLIDDALA